MQREICRDFCAEIRIVGVPLDSRTDSIFTCPTAIDLPPLFLAVLGESERYLRNLLDSTSQEDSFDGVTILQLAMGWPAGVKILLKPQSGIHLPDRFHDGIFMFDITDEDDLIDEYLDCCNILLEAGYTISNADVIQRSSDTLSNLLIHELAKRRNKLLAIAEAHIDSVELSVLRRGETGTPDASAHALCAALTKKGHKIDKTLMFSETRSLYCCYLTPKILKRIYEVGFIDVDLPQGRYTPLISRCSDIWIKKMQTIQSIGWLISKGADPFRKIPGINTAVLHWIHARLTVEIYWCWESTNDFDPNVALCHLRPIDKHLFSLTVRDECFCSCSLGGCTPLSVAIRALVRFIGYREITQLASEFRRFLQFLLDRNLSNPEICHAMIRSLTFDGLNLRHTCCTELRFVSPWDHSRDESDLQEIRKEQKLHLQRFEKLVSEFDAQFDALGLPLMDFLQKIWYERMVKFLSERDKYDYEHDQKTRELGISLEMDELEIPLVVQLICDQIRVVESDSKD